jgi:hypothetical protein
MNDITRSEAMIFAVSVFDAVTAANPRFPSMVIMEVVTRVDFKSDDIPTQVMEAVESLKEEWPMFTAVGEET